MILSWDFSFFFVVQISLHQIFLNFGAETKVVEKSKKNKRVKKTSFQSLYLLKKIIQIKKQKKSVVCIGCEKKDTWHECKKTCFVMVVMHVNFVLLRVNILLPLHCIFVQIGERKRLILTILKKILEKKKFCQSNSGGACMHYTLCEHF